MIIIAKRGERSGYYVKCEVCGKEVYKTKTQYNKAKHHFCGNECSSIYHHNNSVENRFCEICGSKFSVSKKSTQRFCSRKCQGKWQSTQIGELNPRTNRIDCNCESCNKPIEIIPGNYNRFKHHFCSNQCRQNWYSNVFSQDENWREESRIRATKILSNKCIDTNTKPQKIINELLDDMNIKYINEYNFIYYAMDNYLPDYNLAIEVMGDYWHCNPNKYTENNISDMQKKRIKQDKAKNTYIHKYYGINILYLWESDIYNSIELCTKLIQEYINNNGVLQNYHSFNYSVNNNKIILNNNVIKPYQY